MKYLSMPLVVSLFVVVTLLDWYYAYAVQYQPGIIISSWSVVFPFVSLFYAVFSSTASYGLYYQQPWGLRLAAFMILYGCIIAMLSFGVAVRTYPEVQQIYVALLILNGLVLLYIGVYYYYLLQKKQRGGV